MNASDLAIRVAERTRLTQKTAREVIGAALEEITRGLESDGRVTLSGFGTFEIRTRRARSGRDPRTGETLALPGRQVVVFRAGTGLRESLRSERDPASVNVAPS